MYAWLFWAVSGMAGCALANRIPATTDNPQIEGRIEQSGLHFETSSSRPIALTLREGVKMGLLHDDKDDADQYVRVILEQSIFSLKSSNPALVIVERRGMRDLLKEFKFQAEGLVRDQDLAKIGQFLGLDYVVVFDSVYSDLNELYGLNNQIDTWEVMIPVKIIAVNTAEVKLNCLSTAKARVGRVMKATEVRTLNREALGIAARLGGQCLLASMSN